MRILLTGGRAPATLELARLLRASGAVLVLAESIPWSVSSFSFAFSKRYSVPPPRQNSLLFVHRILDIVRKEGIELIIPTCEEIFHLVQHEDLIRPFVELFAPDFPLLRKLHNKYDFIELIGDIGLTAPPTISLTSCQQLMEHVEKYGLEHVYKPQWSRFATHTHLSPPDCRWVSEAQIAESTPWVAQKRVFGQQFCTYSWFSNGRLLLHCNYPMQFHSATGASLVFEHQDHPQLKHWVETFGQKTKVTGQIAFDFIIDENNVPMAIECNPRLTSGIHCFYGSTEMTTALKMNVVLSPVPMAVALKVVLLVFAPSEIRMNGFRNWLQRMYKSRGVLFRWTDPFPLFGCGISYLLLLWRAFRYGISTMEASTVDIEWNGEL